MADASPSAPIRRPIGFRPPGGAGRTPREHPRGLRPGPGAGRRGPGERRLDHRRRAGRARPRRRHRAALAPPAHRRPAAGRPSRRTFPSLVELYGRVGADFELSLDVKDPAALSRSWPPRTRPRPATGCGCATVTGAAGRLAASRRCGPAGRLDARGAHRGAASRPGSRGLRSAGHRCPQPASPGVDRRAGGGGPRRRPAGLRLGRPDPGRDQPAAGRRRRRGVLRPRRAADGGHRATGRRASRPGGRAATGVAALRASRYATAARPV